MKPVQFDYLIAGRGIAGSLLAWFLSQAGKKVVVVDPESVNTSSKIAAGLMHPVTGRRIVKTWNADLLIPFARKTYAGIEDKLGERFFEDYPVLEIFHDIAHRNDWAGRSAEEGMQDYVKDECPPSAIPQGINAPYGGRWVVNGGWLDIKRFLDAIQRYLSNSASLIRDHIEYSDVNFTNEYIEWKGVRAGAIIDCTGAEASKNPLFEGIAFNPCKGELLHLRATGLPRDIVINGKVKLIPLGGYDYIAGATYDFNNPDSHPSTEGRQNLEKALRQMLNAEFEVTGHFAGIRPASKDRRPLIGKHRSIPGLYIFNGLGSKGVMLGPWHAWNFCNELAGVSEPEAEASLYR